MLLHGTPCCPRIPLGEQKGPLRPNTCLLISTSNRWRESMPWRYKTTEASRAPRPKNSSALGRDRGKGMVKRSGDDGEQLCTCTQICILCPR